MASDRRLFTSGSESAAFIFSPNSAGRLRPAKCWLSLARFSSVQAHPAAPSPPSVMLASGPSPQSLRPCSAIRSHSSSNAAHSCRPPWTISTLSPCFLTMEHHIAPRWRLWALRPVPLADVKNLARGRFEVGVNVEVHKSLCQKGGRMCAEALTRRFRVPPIRAVKLYRLHLSSDAPDLLVGAVVHRFHQFVDSHVQAGECSRGIDATVQGLVARSDLDELAGCKAA